MNSKMKTALTWIIVIFVIYAIVTSPERSADILQGVLDVIVSAFHSIGKFFHSLMN